MVGYLQSTIKGGVRSTSATSYLAPKYLARPNLHVLLNTQAIRVLQSSTGGAGLAFDQVEVYPDKTSKFEEPRLRQSPADPTP